MTNYSRMGSVRALFTLSVAYRKDLGRVRRAITEIAAEDKWILPEPPCDVFVDDQGEAGVRLLVLPTVRPEHYLAVRNDLRERIKARFDAEGIAFAAPRREVRLTEAAPPPQPLDRRASPRRQDRHGADRPAAPPDERTGRAGTTADQRETAPRDGRSQRRGASNDGQGRYGERGMSVAASQRPPRPFEGVPVRGCVHWCLLDGFALTAGFVRLSGLDCIARNAGG